MQNSKIVFYPFKDQNNRINAFSYWYLIFYIRHKTKKYLLNVSNWAKDLCRLSILSRLSYQLWLRWVWGQILLDFCVCSRCFYCSAWLRLELNTNIGLHTTTHHPPPTTTQTFLRTLGSVGGIDHPPLPHSPSHPQHLTLGLGEGGETENLV